MTYVVAGGGSLSGHKLAHQLPRCLIPDKDHVALAFYSRFRDQELAMRIFERLRARDRSESNIGRKLFETTIGDLLRRIEDGTEVTVLPESKLKCRSYCSAEADAHAQLR